MKVYLYMKGYCDNHAKLVAIILPGHLEIKAHFSLGEVSSIASFDPNFKSQLQSSLHFRQGTSNSLLEFIKDIKTRLFPYESFRLMKHECASDLLSDEMKKCFRFFKIAQYLFISSLDENSLRISRKFSNLRWSFYRFFERYNNKHIHQMVATCPGIIIIIVSLQLNNTISIESIDKMISMILGGEKRKNILEFIFEQLYSSNLHSWYLIRTHANQRKNEIFRNWVWVVCNATSKTPAHSIFGPPAFLIPKSDLPKNKSMKAHWIKRTRLLPFMRVPELYPELTISQVKGFILMISKTKIKNYKTLIHSHHPVIRYMAASKRIPKSKTNYNLFFREIIRFRNTMNNVPNYEEMEFYDIEDNYPLHGCDWELSEKELRIKCLQTIHDYRKESVLMKNCIRSCFEMAYKKEALHFHAEIDHAHYSIGVFLDDFKIYEVKGYKNSEPKPDHLLQIHLILVRNMKEITDKCFYKDIPF
jgi:hypothetical protein